MTSERKAAYETLKRKVEALKAELPGINLGRVVRNHEEPWGTDTVWYVVLPHPGRAAKHRDSIYLGRSADIFEKVVAEWSGIEPLIRKMYATDPKRVARA